MIPPLSIYVRCVKRILRVGCVDVAVSMFDYYSPEIQNLIDYVDSRMQHIHIFDFIFVFELSFALSCTKFSSLLLVG